MSHLSLQASKRDHAAAQDLAVQDTDGQAEFEGHVDYYGFHRGAEGWFIGGWLSHPWTLGRRPRDASAEFDGQSIDDHTHSMFYHREDVRGRGIGYVFFLQGPDCPHAPLTAVRILTGDAAQIMHPARNVARFDEAHLVEHLRDILAGAEDGSQRTEMHGLLMGQRPLQQATGFIDVYGYHSISGGWLLCGWLTVPWRDHQPPARATLSFEEGDINGEAFGVLYPRSDLQGGAQGLALFIRSDGQTRGRLVSVAFEAGGIRGTLSPSPAIGRVRESDLGMQLRPLIAMGNDPHRDILLGLLARQPYAGEDTLAKMGTPVFLETDEAIATRSGGLVLMGWFLAYPGEIQQIRLRSGPAISILDLDAAIRINRPDVLDGFSQYGFSDPRCGFITFLPKALTPGSRAYIEVETVRHEVGYRNLARPKLEGIPAMKRLLAAVDVRFSEVADAYDRIIGPAVAGLNRDRLAKRPGATVTDYGTPPTDPRWSVIIPLYGRLDYVEYQLALFSAGPDWPNVEFIYVLDEPARRREAQFLFTSVYERYLVPFRAVILDQNVGYAPANNIGLSYAFGSFVAFINSDVFPGTPDWLSRLTTSLLRDPTIGVIGPLLQFEDGAVQHRGMFFKRLPEFGNWYFGMHHDKGMRYKGTGAPETHLSITGACLVMSRTLAEQLGGFDETYIVGDFEDSDLCLRAQALGYRCVVDPKVQLYHLERKSQASSGLGWRINLTVYNAWQHERRWGATIDAKQAQS